MNKQKKAILIENDFYNYCINNEMSKVKDMFSKPSKAFRNIEAIPGSVATRALVIVCASGYKDLAQYLLTNPYTRSKIDINKNDGEVFISACESGDVELVKFLFEQDELKTLTGLDVNYKFKPLAKNARSCFEVSCKHGHFELTKYLCAHISSDEVSDGFINSCKLQDSQTAKYLLESYELSNKDIKNGFIEAYYASSLDVLSYLIINKKFTITPSYLDLLKADIHHIPVLEQTYSHITNILEVFEQKKLLSTRLTHSPSSGQSKEIFKV